MDSFSYLPVTKLDSERFCESVECLHKCGELPSCSPPYCTPNTSSINIFQNSIRPQLPIMCRICLKSSQMPMHSTVGHLSGDTVTGRYSFFRGVCFSLKSYEGLFEDQFCKFTNGLLEVFTDAVVDITCIFKCCYRKLRFHARVECYHI